MAKVKNNFDIDVNNHIVDMVSPMAIEFSKSHFLLGDSYCKILVLRDFPKNPKIGWESDICNIEGVIYKTSMQKIEPTALIENITQQIRNHKGRLMGTNDELVRIRSTRAIEDFEKLLIKIDQEQQAVFNKSHMLMIMGNSLDEVTKKTQRVIGKLSAKGFKAKPLTCKQRETFESIAPFNFISKEIRSKIERNMPVETVAGGFPFASCGLNDNIGILLGEDMARGGVIIDIWKREGDRNNSNIVVLGVPGVGKSATIKKIIYNEWQRGAKIIIADPQGEYKEFCQNCGGAWINLGGGKGGRINPLEVKNIPEDDEETFEDRLYKNNENGTGSNGMGALALHFQTLRTFFKLYSNSINDVLMARLEEALELAYRNHNIDYDTVITKDTTFPIIEEVYNILLDLSEKFELTKSNTESNDYKTLASLLRSMSVGADKGLWNGHTNVDVESDFICMDTSDLQKADERIQRTQYFNIMSYAWDKVVEDREQRIILVYDEAYLLADESVPEALKHLRNTSKQIRKFEGSLVVISHSCVDFLHEKIRKDGQALMDNPTYKFFMGTDGKNLKELAYLFDLTEAEQEILNAKRKGHVLLNVGNKRVHTAVKLEPYEIKAFGKGGGR